MAEWIDFAWWENCISMQRPGIIFEVANADDERLLTPCIVPLPTPFDWTSAPVRFRLVPEPQPLHSSPLPEPAADAEASDER